MLSAAEFLKIHSTHYLIDTLGFEAHARHLREQRGEKLPDVWYERPFFYSLYLENEKILGSGEIVVIPGFVEKADYEFEIAGFFTEDIMTTQVEEATEYVRNKMLFTIMNDMSARDLQAEDMKLPLSVTASKGVLPKVFGPRWVHGSKLHLDRNGIPHIKVRLLVNREVRCEDNFESIYFTNPRSGIRTCWGFAQCIAWFGGKNQGFKKGHVLGSGTIGNGCIAENALYPWLKDKDVIRMEAEHIGVLENHIQVAAA